MIPYLVKNLRFLQTKVLKVSCHHLEQGNWSRGVTGPASGSSSQKSGVFSKHYSSEQLLRMEAEANSAAIIKSAGHQAFLQLVITCLKELDTESTSKSDRQKTEQKGTTLSNYVTCVGTVV